MKKHMEQDIYQALDDSTEPLAVEASRVELGLQLYLPCYSGSLQSEVVIHRNFTLLNLRERRRSRLFSYPSSSPQLEPVCIVVAVVLEVYLTGDLCLDNPGSSLNPHGQLTLELIR